MWQNDGQNILSTCNPEANCMVCTWLKNVLDFVIWSIIDKVIAELVGRQKWKPTFSTTWIEYTNFTLIWVYALEGPKIGVGYVPWSHLQLDFSSENKN